LYYPGLGFSRVEGVFPFFSPWLVAKFTFVLGFFSPLPTPPKLRPFAVFVFFFPYFLFFMPFVPRFLFAPPPLDIWTTNPHLLRFGTCFFPGPSFVDNPSCQRIKRASPSPQGVWFSNQCHLAFLPPLFIFPLSFPHCMPKDTNLFPLRSPLTGPFLFYFRFFFWNTFPLSH